MLLVAGIHNTAKLLTRILWKRITRDPEWVAGAARGAFRVRARLLRPGCRDRFPSFARRSSRGEAAPRFDVPGRGGRSGTSRSQDGRSRLGHGSCRPTRCRTSSPSTTESRWSSSRGAGSRASRSSAKCAHRLWRRRAYLHRDEPDANYKADRPAEMLLNYDWRLGYEPSFALTVDPGLGLRESHERVPFFPGKFDPLHGAGRRPWNSRNPKPSTSS